ncbi:MAG: glycosyltransferase family 2 protein [Streptosporangiaceae bacterium]
MNGTGDAQTQASARQGAGRAGGRPGTADPVSVIMPVRDAEPDLAESVSQVLSQVYPGELELLLAVGPSRDRTEQIAKDLAAGDPRIKVVANPAGGVPSGLNAALRASRYPVIVRVDTRSRLPAGYIAAAVRMLRQTGAVNVGGIMTAEGVTPFQHAVGWVMTARTGVGPARFHHPGGKAGPSDSVYLGTFRRDAVEAVGGYDERYLRGEDWELNHRLREAGGLVWRQPALRVTYRPRAGLRGLAAQYFLYGRWRRAVSRRHHGTMTRRYLAPPATLIALVIGTLAGLAGVASLADRTGTWWQWLLTAGMAIPLGYLISVLVITAKAGTDGRLSGRAVAWLPVVIATMHLCWGAGFILSSRRLVKPRRAGLSPSEPQAGSAAATPEPS